MLLRRTVGWSQDQEEPVPILDDLDVDQSGNVDAQRVDQGGFGDADTADRQGLERDGLRGCLVGAVGMRNLDRFAQFDGHVQPPFVVQCFRKEKIQPGE